MSDSSAYFSTKKSLNSVSLCSQFDLGYIIGSDERYMSIPLSLL